MNVTVNGEATTVEDASSLADLVRRLAPESEGRGLAVAVNGEVVRRSEWTSTTVADGDRVEILHAVGGG